MKIPDLVVTQRILLLQLESQQLDPSICKSININCRREPEQSRHLHGCRPFRVNDHRKSQFIFNMMDLMVVDRITHTRNGLASAGFLCNQTTQKIHFIRIRHSDHQICRINTGIHLDLKAGAISHNTTHICNICDLLNSFRLPVDHRNIMFFPAKLLCQCTSHFAAARNNYIHLKLLSSCKLFRCL